MIAAHDNTAEPPGQINNLIGISAIANDIPEIPDDVMWWSNGENCPECLEARVNVGDDKGTHISISFGVKLHFCDRAQTLALHRVLFAWIWPRMPYSD